MITIKRPADFGRVGQPALRAFLEREADFINAFERDGDDPDLNGYVVVVEPGDNPKCLPTGVDPLGDLTAIEPWEFAVYDAASDHWYAVVVVSDGFALAFCVPGGVARECGVADLFHDVA